MPNSAFGEAFCFFIILFFFHFRALPMRMTAGTAALTHAKAALGKTLLGGGLSLIFPLFPTHAASK